MPPYHTDGGRPILTLKFPAWVHIVALVLAGLLGVLAYVASEILLPVVGILAIVAAFYTAFYARQAIHSTRIMKRCAETVKFSRLFSTLPIIEMRARIEERFDRIYTATSAINETQQLRIANEEFSRQLRAALESRASIHADEDRDLLIHAASVLDYFEDLAVGLNADVFDDALAKSTLRQPLIQLWDMLAGFVEYYRAQRETTSIFEHTEALRNRWY